MTRTNIRAIINRVSPLTDIKTRVMHLEQFCHIAVQMAPVVLEFNDFQIQTLRLDIEIALSDLHWPIMWHK